MTTLASSLPVESTLHVKDDAWRFTVKGDRPGVVNDALGKVISGVQLQSPVRDCTYPNEIVLVFKDDTRLVFRDMGQHCCELRYFATEDSLKNIIGHELRDVYVRDGGMGPYVGSDYAEILFLHIQTNQTVVVFNTYNIHNGYYGGFDLMVRKEIL